MDDRTGLENRSPCKGAGGSNPPPTVLKLLIMPQENPKEKSYGKEFISWNVLEHPNYQRGFAWYFCFIAIAVGFLIYAVLTHNFLFAFIVIMFGIIFLIHAGREPIVLNFALTEKGVVLGEKVYLWRELKKFYIIYEPPEVKTLYFEFAGMRPRLSIPLDDQEPVKVREILLKFLREDLGKIEEPISEWLGRVLKI